MTAIQPTDPLLKALALALIDHPRASLQELAKAVGVSKATLYRYCPTREQLIAKLHQESIAQFGHSVDMAAQQNAPFRVAFRALIDGHLHHRELFLFLIYNWQSDFCSNSAPESPWLVCQRKIDQFFLRGQKEGLLRIDISAVAMSEMFMGMLVTLVDAERVGRIARADIVGSVELLFFDGAKVRDTLG